MIPPARFRGLAWAAAIFLALGCAPLTVAAKGFRSQQAGHSDPRLYLARGRDYSLDEAVSRIRRRQPGKVLSADTVDEDGRPVHRIRILTDEGRVRRLRIDGRTGRSVQQRRRR